MPVFIDRSHAAVSTAVPCPQRATDQANSDASHQVGSADPRNGTGYERSDLTEVEAMRRLADLFTTLADTTRLRIIEALAQGELCVGELCAALNLTQSATSHQLRLLRGLRLVKPRREGRLVYYSLEDDRIYGLCVQGLAHVRR